MRNEEKLKESYLRQKAIFDEAENRRIEEVRKQKDQLLIKRKKLDDQINRLEQRINSPKKFDSFESFRKKAETQSNESKKS